MSTHQAREVASTGGSCGKHVWMVYALMALHAVCYQLQTPLEPYLVDHLVGKGAAGTTWYGYLRSFYQVIQFIGAVVFGGFLDRYGCRHGLWVSCLASAVCFLLLANSTNIYMLFLSKVPGLLAHQFLTCQTALSQLTPEGPERTAAFGRLITAYTLGGVIGPLAGGRLAAEDDYYTTAKIAVIGSLLGVALSIFGLPSRMERSVVRAGTPLVEEGNGEAAPAPAAEEGPKLLPWKERAIKICSLVGWLIAMRVVMTTVSAMVQAAQAVVLKNELDLMAKQMGTLMSIQFGFFALFSGFLLGPLTRYLGGRARSVVMKCLPVVMMCYFVQAIFRSKTLGLLDGLSGIAQTYVFVGVSMIAVMFAMSMATAITTESTAIIPKEMKGSLLGLEHGIFSGSRILSPAAGLWMLNAAGSSFMYGFTGVVYGLIFLFWIMFSERLLPAAPKKAGDAENEEEAGSTVEMRKCGA